MKADRTAVIVGSAGQDGQLLTRNLESQGYRVVGLNRDTIDILNPNAVMQLISGLHPSEVYFLAAYHHSSEDVCASEGELFRQSFSVNTVAVVNFLDAIFLHSPESRFFYASSCLIFPPSENGMQTEDTSPFPGSAYAISKAAAMSACQYFRSNKGIFASCGILYNHESHLRSKRFVSRKIVSAAVRIAKEGGGRLTLGNLDTKVDWGYAPDFVDAMRRMLQLPEPADYIIATGEPHSIREFVEIAFNHLGLKYSQYVETESNILARTNLMRVGNYSRLNSATGWKPTISFEEMVRMLVDAEVNSFE